jgi:hypothetical protein
LQVKSLHLDEIPCLSILEVVYLFQEFAALAKTFWKDKEFDASSNEKAPIV